MKPFDRESEKFPAKSFHCWQHCLAWDCGNRSKSASFGIGHIANWRRLLIISIWLSIPFHPTKVIPTVLNCIEQLGNWKMPLRLNLLVKSKIDTITRIRSIQQTYHSRQIHLIRNSSSSSLAQSSSQSIINSNTVATASISCSSSRFIYSIGQSRMLVWPLSDGMEWIARWK